MPRLRVTTRAVADLYLELSQDVIQGLIDRWANREYSSDRMVGGDADTGFWAIDLDEVASMQTAPRNVSRSAMAPGMVVSGAIYPGATGP